jgi:hypothetical protein
MPIFWAICFIAATVAFTASPPSMASCAALEAMESVSLAFSVFWFTDALACSMVALVSSTLAACSLDDWLRLCAVALTSSEAPAKLCALPLTLPTTCWSLCTICCVAYSMLLVSPLRTCTCMLKSPLAMRFMMSAAYMGSPPSCLIKLRPISQAANTATSTAAKAA